MFPLLRKCRWLNLPLDIQLEFFKKVCIQSFWMVVKRGRTRAVSKLQLRLFKLVVGVKFRTTSCMAFGELGKYLIEIEAK